MDYQPFNSVFDLAEMTQEVEASHRLVSHPTISSMYSTASDHVHNDEHMHDTHADQKQDETSKDIDMSVNHTNTILQSHISTPNTTATPSPYHAFTGRSINIAELMPAIDSQYQYQYPGRGAFKVDMALVSRQHMLNMIKHRPISIVWGKIEGETSVWETPLNFIVEEFDLAQRTIIFPHLLQMGLPTDTSAFQPLMFILSHIHTDDHPLLVHPLINIIRCHSTMARLPPKEASQRLANICCYFRRQLCFCYDAKYRPGVQSHLCAHTAQLSHQWFSDHGIDPERPMIDMIPPEDFMTRISITDIKTHLINILLRDFTRSITYMMFKKPISPCIGMCESTMYACRSTSYLWHRTLMSAFIELNLIETRYPLYIWTPMQFKQTNPNLLAAASHYSPGAFSVHAGCIDVNEPSQWTALDARLLFAMARHGFDNNTALQSAFNDPSLSLHRSGSIPTELVSIIPDANFVEAMKPGCVFTTLQSRIDDIKDFLFSMLTLLLCQSRSPLVFDSQRCEYEFTRLMPSRDDDDNDEGVLFPDTDVDQQSGGMCGEARIVDIYINF
eukprot:gnl/Dysnectes_brevis/9327_a17241_209.p1 GENE.gnl/Dysnectes_brevis/9327_a17241_209~~gnl/Dysnectes_brevis/9327_a17241_209.p1  ORF type:complete len:558 (+),score=3.66 gnl/Dysnectes_brevis/9327_a17241_209:131-1804(+)